uniref:Uncharacterized protein n=1 Tax=Anguilla anguilla TaxID=7936 RepID=A0A0E9UL06_ANGAN
MNMKRCLYEFSGYSFKCDGHLEHSQHNEYNSTVTYNDYNEYLCQALRL